MNTISKSLLPFFAFAALSALLFGCGGDSNRDAIGKTEVLIETSEGDIVVRLYDDTPIHRDNFIRNVEGGERLAPCRQPERKVSLYGEM